jgi:hypothetical protein
MDTTTVILATLAGLALVLYLLRRRSRLSRDDD